MTSRPIADRLPRRLLLIALVALALRVMETLGRSQISLTVNTYAHVLPNLQREAAEKMNSALLG